MANPNSFSKKKSLTPGRIEKGIQAYHRGNINDAVELLLEGIKHSPDDPHPYFELAEILLRTHNFKDAMDVINEMPRGKGDIRKFELMGYCSLGMDLDQEAIKHARHALSLNGSSPKALNLMGALSFKQGNINAAKNYFKKAIKADPGYGEPHTNLGKMCRHSKPEDTLNFLEKGFILSPDIPDIVSSYHFAITESGEFERAAPIFENAVSAYPFIKTLRYRFIDVLLKQGNNEQVMHQIEEAIVLFGADDGILVAALKIRERLGPLEVQKDTKEKKNTVSLCMIVKNEEMHLAQCLKSVEPVVDEIIVVDTGSTDQTKEIATVFGAEVYEFPWSDDFSAARNFSLSKALGRWIFVLDADEVLSSVDYSAFRKLLQKPAGSTATAYSFETRNYTLLSNTVGWVANAGLYRIEEAGIGWAPSTKVRLFPNRPDVRFKYPVHEKVEPSLDACGIPIHKTEIPIHHYGKLDTGKTAEKTAVYYHLGKEKLSEMVNDVGAIREQAIQAGELGKYEDAVFLWQKVAELKPDLTEAFINMGGAHWQVGRFEQARICSERALQLAPEMKEAHYNHAVSLLFLGRCRLATEMLERILEKTPEYLPARFMLATAYCCRDQKEKAKNAFNELTKTKIGIGLNAALKDIVNRFMSVGQTGNARKVVETAMEIPNHDPSLLKLLNKTSSF